MAMAIGAFMVTGMLTVVQASASSFRLQQGLGQVQENARFAAMTMAAAIRSAGFQPQPWAGAGPTPAIAAGTADSLSARGDRLVLRRWSDRNCQDQPNPVKDSDGRAVFYLLEIQFQVSASNNLAVTCRYGPGPGQLTTQVNNLGLVEQVEMLQLQFAEDSDGDGAANRWVRAGQWQDESGIMGVRLGLLLASPMPLDARQHHDYQVLDQWVTAPADGRLRRVMLATVPIHGRSK